MAEGTLQLVGGASDRLVQGLCLVCHDGGLTTSQTDLHHAALVELPVLGATLVTEMDFNPGDSIVESAQGIFHHTCNVLGELLAPYDVAVCIDLDVHVLFLRPSPLGAG
jgi:hypothetical protein